MSKLISTMDTDSAFHTAVIIHNMILNHDGLDVLWLDDKSREASMGVDEIDNSNDGRNDSEFDIYCTTPDQINVRRSLKLRHLSNRMVFIHKN